jgi:2-hydroxyglutarate dehydrogenase
MLPMRRLAVSSGLRRRRGLATGVPREAADAVVVGAGVVGLAVARALAMAGREVLVVEAAPSFGTGTSSRNSEVIHAGIYYPPRSLKVRACSLLFAVSTGNGLQFKVVFKTRFARGY